MGHFPIGLLKTLSQMNHKHIPKSHVFRDGVKELDLEELKQINKSIIRKAKENKIYRNGSTDGLVIVGIDGVESFESYKKDWNMKHCFMADEKAIQIILQMMTICYNLWELYLYSHLHNFQNMNITKMGYIEIVAENMSLAKAGELMFSSA